MFYKNNSWPGLFLVLLCGCAENRYTSNNTNSGAISSAYTYNNGECEEPECGDRKELIAIERNHHSKSHNYDRVPVIDAAFCHQTGELYLQEDKAQFRERCEVDEAKAKTQLAVNWSSFKRLDRQICVDAGSAPVSSYIELLTCLEMASAVTDTGVMAKGTDRQIIASEEDHLSE